jgi:hypothetical protein
MVDDAQWLDHAAAHISEKGGSSWQIGGTVRPPTAAPGAPRPIDLLLDGGAILLTEGHAAAATVQRAAQLLARIPVEQVLRLAWCGHGRRHHCIQEFLRVFMLSPPTT